MSEENSGNRGKNKESSRASKRGKSKTKGENQFASMITMAKKMESESDDADMANFAGQFCTLLEKFQAKE